MLTRILTALIALAVLVPILLFAPAAAVVALFMLLLAVAVYEIAGVTGLAKEYGIWIPFACLLCLPNLLSLFLRELVMQAGPSFGSVWAFASRLMAVLPYLFLIIFAVVRYGKLNIANLLAFFGMSLYVALGFQSMAELSVAGAQHELTQLPAGLYFRERVFLWITLAIPWVADSLAYFSGRFFGKRKLCPNVSPKKTVAGAVGGVAGTGVIGAVLFGCFMGWNPVSVAVAGVVSMLLAIVSIFGDLFASVVKRHFGIKDYGKLFPGHGGVLDRFDSNLPVSILMSVVVFALLIG